MAWHSHRDHPDSDAALQALALAFRRLPIPVVGRINAGRLIFDLRTLDHTDQIMHQLDQLVWPPAP